MNHFQHWCLLSSAALALLIATTSARPLASPLMGRVALVADAVQDAVETLRDPVPPPAEPRQADAQEPAAVLLLFSGVGAAWLTRRRSFDSSR